MLHLLAKAAEMRSEEEIGVDARDIADRATLERAGDATDAGEIAAVLHHGVNPSRAFGARDQVARFAKRLRHRFFAEHVAARREAGRDDVMPRRWHDDVEQKVGMGLGDQALDVTGDSRVLEAEFRRPVLGASQIEISEADDAEIGDFRRRLKPGPTHCAAADEGRSELHRRPSSRASASTAD